MPKSNELAQSALKILGLPQAPDALAGRGKWRQEKSLVVALVRARTSVRCGWLAQRLAMGHESSISRAVRQAQEDLQWSARLRKRGAQDYRPEMTKVQEPYAWSRNVEFQGPTPFNRQANDASALPVYYDPAKKELTTTKTDYPAMGIRNNIKESCCCLDASNTSGR